ncbi:hypothetical protein, partial [Ralstonia pseudosolanacearum]|uniref:hypothetical protein n=1 Tax=Ralstonia pseudosolanacearum TaxID=1310165 RepID=UPI0032219E4E
TVSMRPRDSACGIVRARGAGGRLKKSVRVTACETGCNDFEVPSCGWRLLPALTARVRET